MTTRKPQLPERPPLTVELTDAEILADLMYPAVATPMRPSVRS